MSLVFRQGMTLVATGLVIGAAAAFGVGRLLQSQLLGVSAGDPLTFIGVTSLLVAVALAACYAPARRAMKVEPMAALRYE